MSCETHICEISLRGKEVLIIRNNKLLDFIHFIDPTVRGILKSINEVSSSLQKKRLMEIAGVHIAHIQLLSPGQMKSILLLTRNVNIFTLELSVEGC